MIGIYLFLTALLLLLLGFPVAFTFGGTAIFFGLLSEEPGIFNLMPHRIFAIMNNTILIGATAFSVVFTYNGADYIVEDFMMALPGEKWGFLIFSMSAIMTLGFFIDFVEIAYIDVPILSPIAARLGIDPLW